MKRSFSYIVSLPQFPVWCLLILLAGPAAVRSAAHSGPRTLLVKLTDALPQSQSGRNSSLLKISTPQLEALAGQPGVIGLRPFLAARPALARTGAEELSARAELEKWLIIDLTDAADAESLAAVLRLRPEVAVVSLNRTFHLDSIPDDPLLARQYGLKKIAAAAAWEIESGNRSVIAGVIDTGIDYRHPDLAANIWINSGEDLNGNGLVDSLDFNAIDDDGNGYIDDVQGWDFTDAPNYPDGGDYRDRDADPMDEMGHGTAVAGIIAAVAGNGIGISGVAPGCRVMNLRAFTAGGNGEEDDVAAAILYASENGAAVINMSWGDVFVSRLLDDVIHYAAGRNVVLVASSGNSATDQIHYPSAFANTISVGATDASDQLAGFSNYGPSLDLVAPGVNILSTIRSAQYDSSLNGTSFSAPFVSAAAALLISQDSSRTPDAIKSLLTTSSDDLGPQGWDVYYGAGRLNLARALSPEPQAAVRIQTPWLDQGYQKGPIDIVGSAWTPSLQSYTLAWGMGDNPSEWNEINPPQSKRVIDGLLGVWESIPSQDTSYTIRLQIQNRNGSVEQSQVRIFIDQTAPVISDVELLPMFDAENPSFLVQFNTDDLCEGSLLYRALGSDAPWQDVPMNYRSYQPRLHVTRELATGQLNLLLQAENSAGLATVHDHLFQADLSQPPINTMRFTRLDQTLPHGHLLDQSADFDHDGRPEIIIGYFDEQHRLYTTLFTSDPSGFRQLYTLPESMIPRSIGDSDGDGRPELLCGYGFTTWLYEAGDTEPFSLQLLRQWQGDGNTQYWGSRLADLVGDSRSELIIRMVDSADGAFHDRFDVWQNTGAGEFTTIASLTNPTAGDNLNGVPRCETGDFDGDGLPEVLLGDSDGDIYIYESDGSSFHSTWQDRLPLLDAIDFISAGDFDGDGEAEFAAGSHSDPNLNTEHAYDARHWCYRIYDKAGDNNYVPVAEWRFFGYESPKDFESGVSNGDADGDGRAEIFIAAFPDLYVAEYEPDAGYTLSFYAATIQANCVAVLDADGDSLAEFWASDGKAIRPWVLAGSLTGPAMPVGLSAKPVDAGAVDLSWYPVPGAQNYLLFRGSSENGLAFYQKVAQTTFRDTLVSSGELYYYAVASEDTTRSPAQSLKSGLVSARPGERPGLVSAARSGERSVRVRFSEIMGAQLQDPRHYSISPDAGRPATCLPLASGQEVLLNFASPFAAAGRYQLKVSGLEDSDGTPLDSARSSIEFEIVFAAEAPYLSAVYGLANGTVELLFNEPMLRTSLEESGHYDAGAGMTVVKAEAVGPDYQAVRLHLAGKIAWGAVGKPLTIRVSGLVSARGMAIQPGRGDAIQLLFAAANLDRVHTFPNPFRQGVDTQGITFANLTPEAEIRIMTTEGRTLRLLYESNGDGGLEWDVCDEQGHPVPSGIYIYRILSSGMVKLGKLAVVR
jgi:subtilisin family serine protease